MRYIFSYIQASSGAVKLINTLSLIFASAWLVKSRDSPHPKTFITSGSRISLLKFNITIYRNSVFKFLKIACSGILGLQWSNRVSQPTKSRIFLMLLNDAILLFYNCPRK